MQDGAASALKGRFMELYHCSSALVSQCVLSEGPLCTLTSTGRRSSLVCGAHSKRTDCGSGRPDVLRLKLKRFTFSPANLPNP